MWRRNWLRMGWNCQPIARHQCGWIIGLSPQQWNKCQTISRKTQVLPGVDQSTIMGNWNQKDGYLIGSFITIVAPCATQEGTSWTSQPHFWIFEESSVQENIHGPRLPQHHGRKIYEILLDQVLQICRRAIPLNMPEARGHALTMHCFMDLDHAGDKATKRSQTGILIFCNCAPIVAYSKW